jgi:hypothetical protein
MLVVRSVRPGTEDTQHAEIEPRVRAGSVLVEIAAFFLHATLCSRVKKKRLRP